MAPSASVGQAAFLRAKLRSGTGFWVSGRFFVRPLARFFVPTRAVSWATRAGAVKDALFARPSGLVLDGPEHGAMLGVVGATTIGIPSAVNCASRCGPQNTLTVPSGYSIATSALSGMGFFMQVLCGLWTAINGPYFALSVLR